MVHRFACPAARAVNDQRKLCNQCVFYFLPVVPEPEKGTAPEDDQCAIRKLDLDFLPSGVSFRIVVAPLIFQDSALRPKAFRRNFIMAILFSVSAVVIDRFTTSLH